MQFLQPQGKTCHADLNESLRVPGKIPEALGTLPVRGKGRSPPGLLRPFSWEHGLPVVQHMVERRTHLALRVRLSDHYERPAEIVDPKDGS